jgi:Ca-activated chloride channel family protein
VARAGRAEAFIVTDQNEASKQAFRFNQYISAPVLTNIHLEAEGVELYGMEPAQVPDLLAERPLMILGKYRNATDSANLKLKGVNGAGEHQWVFELGEAATGDNTLPRLWARKKLERLYVIPEEDEQAQQQAILELGLKYSLLTSRTSFVAVDETPRNSTGKATDVKQPLPLPKGVSNLAIGQPMPEPELYWLVVFGLLVWLINKLKTPKHEISIR